MFKLIACDVDGTLLLNGAKDISKNMLQMIHNLREYDVKFAVSSGRQYTSLRKIFGELADDILYICENGALVMKDGEKLSEVTMNQVSALGIISDILERSGCEVLVTSAKKSYLKPKTKEFENHIRNYLGNDVEIVESYECLSEKILKVAMYNKDGVEAFTPELIDRWDQEVQVVVPGTCWLDFSAKGVNKGNGVKVIQELLGVDIEETVAFGDSYNDIEMFKRSYFSYAMSHAPSEIRAIARYVTPSVDSILIDIIRIFKNM